MKSKVLCWVFLVLATVICHFCLRYGFGDFQGYLTVDINGSACGFAHVKNGTFWVSDHDLKLAPGAAFFGAVLSVVALAMAVRHAYRVTLCGKC